ncbi:MAG: 50S ribosomal protein L13 [Candidatus Doudnabacteria bacterium]|nr:50S ribosomal protein L13 [Candidatus Doudnabacteria bacterium]
MKTVKPLKVQSTDRKWYEVDLSQAPLGRASSKIATLLTGKHKVSYAPYLDAGDYVVAVNSLKIQLTGNKLSQKKYHHFSGYPGGLKTTPALKLMETRPDFVVRHAVRGMLPKNKLRKIWLSRLKIVNDTMHSFKIDSQITI